MDVLKVIKDSDGDRVRIFKRVDNDGIERIYAEIEIDVTRDWIKKGLHGLYESLKNTVSNGKYIHEIVLFDYENATLNNSEIDKFLAGPNNIESLFHRKQKHNILSKLVFKKL